MKYTSTEITTLLVKTGNLAKELNKPFSLTKKDIDSDEKYEELNAVSKKLQKEVNQKSTVCVYDAIYPGNLRFQHFKGLIQINDLFQKKEMPMYLLFNPENIKHYNNCSNENKEKFTKLFKELQICKFKGESGIKSLGHNKMKVKTQINGFQYNSFIAFELKDPAISHRIGLYKLEPISGNGPTILVAGFYLEDGFKHDKNKKKLNSTFVFPALNIQRPEDRVSVNVLANQGFFAKNNKPVIDTNLTIKSRNEITLRAN